MKSVADDIDDEIDLDCSSIPCCISAARPITKAASLIEEDMFSKFPAMPC